MGANPLQLAWVWLIARAVGIDILCILKGS